MGFLPSVCTTKNSANMGRVRTKTVKRASRLIIEKYYTRLTLDFQTNKRVVEEFAVIPSKRLRNKIAGFVTHLMKRIQKGPVRGISIKLQEEERERRDQYVPDVSALSMESIDIDEATKQMLESLDIPKVANTNVVAHSWSTPAWKRNNDRKPGQAPYKPRA